MKRNPHWVVLLLTLCLCLSGCSLLPRLSGFAPEPADPPCHTPAFPPNPNTEALGSAERFLDIAEAAAHNLGRTTTLAEITTAAGWSQDWDRMVQRISWMHPADLNRFTETTGVCWSYWSDDLEGAGRVGSYIFMRGNQPVQSIDWDKTDRWPLADTDDSRLSILKDAPLIPVTPTDPVLEPVVAPR